MEGGLLSAELPSGVPSSERLTWGQTLIAVWGVGGVVVLVVQAIVRLTPMALTPWQEGLYEPWQAVLCVLWMGLNGYMEGYRGFQRSFSPRTVGRALHLARHPSWGWVVLGPLYSMGLVHATRRRLISVWCLTLGICALVVVVRLLPQPWRGLVDAGVVVGLVYGGLATLLFFVRALAGSPPKVPLDLPVQR